MSVLLSCTCSILKFLTLIQRAKNKANLSPCVMHFSSPTSTAEALSSFVSPPPYLCSLSTARFNARHLLDVGEEEEDLTNILDKVTVTEVSVQDEEDKEDFHHSPPDDGSPPDDEPPSEAPPEPRSIDSFPFGKSPGAAETTVVIVVASPSPVPCPPPPPSPELSPKPKPCRWWGGGGWKC